jgi:hypothetical protein
MDTKLECLIARRGHYAALPTSAYSYGLAAQAGIIPLFDRGIKRIHVDMDDPPEARRGRGGSLGHQSRWAP